MWKTVKNSWKLWLITGLSLIALVSAICYFFSAENLGTKLGSRNGTAMGSINGFIDGKSAGEADGKEAGLSAEDTTVDVKGFFEGAGDMGVLQVLSASVDMSNVHSIGENYAALYHMIGKAVFTVDLNNAEVLTGDDSVFILIPVPEVKVEIDETQTKKIAEYQNVLFNGKTSEGYEAHVNSQKEVMSNLEETVTNYDTLMDMAKKSALSTVKELAENVSTEERKVIVNFKEV